MNGVILLPGALGATEISSEFWFKSIGGIPFIYRQSRLMRSAGIEKLLLVASSTERLSIESFADENYFREDIEVIIVEDSNPNSLVEIVEENVGDSPMVILKAEWLFDKSAIEFASNLEVDSRQPHFMFMDGEAAGLVTTLPVHLGQSIEWLRQNGGDFVQSTQDIQNHELSRSQLVAVIEDEGQLSMAEQSLWNRTRKPTDGFVARYLGRNISVYITKRIVSMPITPNQVSMISLLLGLIAAVMVAQGTYLWALSGALMLGVNNILDGVDGELARIRIESSVQGEWLDTIADDVSNMSFFAAIGVGKWIATDDLAWIWLSAAAVTPLFLMSSIYYVWLLRIGRGDVLAFDWFGKENSSINESSKNSFPKRLIGVGTQLFRRETFVTMIVLTALFGVIEFSLFVVAPAAWISLAALSWKAVHNHNRIDSLG